jgi:hypothetical protein
MFDRFWRVDKVRSRARQMIGALASVTTRRGISTELRVARQGWNCGVHSIFRFIVDHKRMAAARLTKFRPVSLSLTLLNGRFGLCDFIVLVMTCSPAFSQTASLRAKSRMKAAR